MPDSKQLGVRGVIDRLSNRYLKWTAYGLVILLAVLLQSAPRLFPAVFGARPILIVPVVVAIAMFEGPVGGAAAGIAGGLLWDMFSTRLLGFNALLLLVVCCACGLLIRLLMRNNFLSAMLMITCALLLVGLADWFFYHLLLSRPEPMLALLRVTLPNAAYSLVLSPLLYAGVYGVAKLLRARS